MNGRSILGAGVVIAWAYAALIYWLDYQHSLTYPHEKRVVISQPGPVSFGTIDVSVIEEPGFSADDFVQRKLTLNIGSEYFTADDEAWINTRADPDNYRERYLERFDMGYLVSDSSRRLYIVETLQGEYTLADEPRVNLWSVDEQGHIASLAAMTLTQVRQEPAWSAVFAGTHAAAPRAVPAIAALIFGLGLLLSATGRFWRDGSWGIVCALTHFLVPIIGGAPLLSAQDQRHLVPAMVLAFVLTAGVGALLARGWRTLRIQSIALRASGAFLVPFATLLMGVTAAVGLSVAFAQAVDGSGPGSASQRFASGIVRPAELLLRTGAGVALLLTLVGGCYDIFMARKIRRSKIRPV